MFGITSTRRVPLQGHHQHGNPPLPCHLKLHLHTSPLLSALGCPGTQLAECKRPTPVPTRMVLGPKAASGHDRHMETSGTVSLACQCTLVCHLNHHLRAAPLLNALGNPGARLQSASVQNLLPDPTCRDRKLVLGSTYTWKPSERCHQHRNPPFLCHLKHHLRTSPLLSELRRPRGQLQNANVQPLFPMPVVPGQKAIPDLSASVPPT